MSDNQRWLHNGEPVDDETNAAINAQVAEGCERCRGLGFGPPWMEPEQDDGSWDCHLCSGSGRKDGDRSKPYGIFKPADER